MYYASLNGAGVATAFTVFSAGTAGLYGMATSKDFEGQGIGRALLRRCVDEAFERGVDVMTLQAATGSKAEEFYRNAGFTKAYVSRKWARKGGKAPKARAEEE
jgi:GNAT superfamily N-acetyltransferase